MIETFKEIKLNKKKLYIKKKQNGAKTATYVKNLRKRIIRKKLGRISKLWCFTIYNQRELANIILCEVLFENAPDTWL